MRSSPSREGGRGMSPSNPHCGCDSCVAYREAWHAAHPWVEPIAYTILVLVVSAPILFVLGGSLYWWVRSRIYGEAPPWSDGFDADLDKSRSRSRKAVIRDYGLDPRRVGISNRGWSIGLDRRLYVMTMDGRPADDGSPSQTDLQAQLHPNFMLMAPDPADPWCVYYVYNRLHGSEEDACATS